MFYGPQDVHHPGQSVSLFHQPRQEIEFGLSEFIAGWTERMQLAGKGGMIELEIPSKLGYGDQGEGGVIPGGATLHFLVELVDVK